MVALRSLVRNLFSFTSLFVVTRPRSGRPIFGMLALSYLPFSHLQGANSTCLHRQAADSQRERGSIPGRLAGGLQHVELDVHI